MNFQLLPYRDKFRRTGIVIYPYFDGSRSRLCDKFEISMGHPNPVPGVIS